MTHSTTALHNECIGNHIRDNKHRTRMFLATVIAYCILAPAPAFAVVRSADRVDGRNAAQLHVPKAAMPDVAMRAGALVTSDGRVLWSRRVNDERAIASIVKVMTAVVALENSSPDDPVTVTRDSLSVGESTSFLRAGEKLPMSDLLEALLVKSGNDAAVAVALHIGGSEERFVSMMNRKAADLGLTHTHFTNPHGLDQKGLYSSAGDLAVLARYAMAKPVFRKIVGRKVAQIGHGSRAEKVTNTNLLLGNYAGANGVKTGWTSDAGYSVIVSARRDGIELYAVVLGARGELSRFREGRELLDFGFAHYRPQRLASAGTIIGEAPVMDYLDLTAPAAVSEDATVAVFDLAGPISRTVSVSAVDAPVDRGERIGVATFTQQGELVASIPLVATEAVPDPTLLQRVGITVIRVWRRLVGTE